MMQVKTPTLPLRQSRASRLQSRVVLLQSRASRLQSSLPTRRRQRPPWQVAVAAAVPLAALAAFAYVARRWLFQGAALVADAVEEAADAVEDAAEDLAEVARERAERAEPGGAPTG